MTFDKRIYFKNYKKYKKKLTRDTYFIISIIIRE